MPNLFPLCSTAGMTQLSPHAVAQAIRSAPAFARLGLSMRSADMRERAADALALAIVEGLERPLIEHDDAQIALPL